MKRIVVLLLCLLLPLCGGCGKKSSAAYCNPHYLTDSVIRVYAA